MSDEPEQGKQEHEQQKLPAMKWGDPISPEREAELQEYLDRWQAETDRGDRKGPFDGGPEEYGVRLTGMDVYWLAEQSGRNAFGGSVPNLHLEGANLPEAHLEYAYLSGAHLEGANLSGAHLQGANLHLAHLEGAYLSATGLQGAYVVGAHLEGADLEGAYLQQAYLVGAHLESKVYLPDDAELLRIRTWAPDFPATLPPADLRGDVFDAATTLQDVNLGTARRGAVRVADLRWGGANLAVVDWGPLTEPKTELGDEKAARTWKPQPYKPSSEKLSSKERRQEHQTYDARQAAAKLELFRAAVRANRQLATALRDQGMNEEADQFAYRAQVVQRQVFWQQRKRGRAVFSWFLDRVAGHGYKPERSLYTYLLVIGVFTGLYLLAGAGILTFGLPTTQFHQLAWYEALVLSVASFHGRGFFQPVQSPGDPVAILAAIEAIFGLFIEVSFIATFTQRFFGK